MKKSIRNIILGLWLVLGTILLGRWWYEHPDTFPPLPQQLWSWLDKLYGAENIDGATDVEALVVLVFAFASVAALTGILLFIWRRVQTALTHHSDEPKGPGSNSKG